MCSLRHKYITVNVLSKNKQNLCSCKITIKNKEINSGLLAFTCTREIDKTTKKERPNSGPQRLLFTHYTIYAQKKYR